MSITESQMQECITEMVKGIVEYPDQVVIEKSSDDMGILFLVKVHPGDTGRVIGRDGITTNAIRRIIHAMRISPPNRVSVKIDAPSRQRDGY